MGVNVQDDYRRLASWPGPMLVRTLDGQQYVTRSVQLHEHVIEFVWAGDEPTGQRRGRPSMSATPPGQRPRTGLLAQVPLKTLVPEVTLHDLQRPS
jgi:hypothetical protein